jgi:hypothetical protein
MPLRNLDKWEIIEQLQRQHLTYRDVEVIKNTCETILRGR